MKNGYKFSSMARAITSLQSQIHPLKSAHPISPSRSNTIYSTTPALSASAACAGGRLYFSAPSALLRHLLVTLGEVRVDHTYMADMVGEAANTLSGNSRRELGQDLVISPPTVIEGIPSDHYLPQGLRSLVIPITWQKYRASLVLSVEGIHE